MTALIHAYVSAVQLVLEALRSVLTASRSGDLPDHEAVQALSAGVTRLGALAAKVTEALASTMMT